MKAFFYILIIVACCNFNFAQDIHWSQYDNNPVFQNPANVGSFDGDYRFYANYRDQWRSVTVPFQTFSLSGEIKRIYNNLNLGVFLFNDISGDGSFSTIELQPSVSYILKLTEDSTNLLKPGIQFGGNFRSLNTNAFYFDNQWNGQELDETLPTNENFNSSNKTNFTWGLGVAYEFQKGKRERVTIGAGLFNINRPNQGFFGDKIKRNMRFNFFTAANYKIGFNWDVLPSIQLNLQGKYMELNLGSQVRYILRDKLGEYRAVLGGVFMRSSDSFFITAGLAYQNWQAGISYDINYSDLTPASNSRGGLELSLRYIIHKFKPKEIKHRICPDFI